MIENIKNLYDVMLDETKRDAIDALVNEFNYSKIAIKQNWIYGKSIPDEHQKKVVEIFQKLLKKQHDMTAKILMN